MRGDISAAHIEYRKLGYFPYFVGVCVDKTAFAREMKRLKADPLPLLSTGSASFPPLGMATYKLHNRDGGYHLSVVAVNLPHYRRSPACEAAGACAHEATHVVSNMMEVIGESRPSEEFFAYTVEEVAGWLYRALRK